MTDTSSRLLLAAVSQRIDRSEARREVRDALDHRLTEWLLEVGVLAIPVPNGLAGSKALEAWLAACKPQVVVLSGGNDIGAFPSRDDTEAALIDYAATARLPLLGICRGMQMLAHNAGTVLVPVEGHAGSRHRILTDDAPIGPMPAETNSYHDWQLAACPSDFEILAKAEDGTLEAIRHRSLPWEGWMWHPEREAPFAPEDIARARSLIFEGCRG